MSFSPETTTSLEWKWYDKCGIEGALALLEREGRWKAAIQLAEQIGRSGSPRAEDARKIAERIGLEHFIYRGRQAPARKNSPKAVAAHPRLLFAEDKVPKNAFFPLVCGGPRVISAAPLSNTFHDHVANSYSRPPPLQIFVTLSSGSPATPRTAFSRWGPSLVSSPAPRPRRS